MWVGPCISSRTDTCVLGLYGMRDVFVWDLYLGSGL